MNKTAKVACILALLGLVSTYGIIFGKSSPNAQISTEEYAILTYFTDTKAPYVVDGERFGARIFYGGGTVENVMLSKEELKAPVSNAAAGILLRLGQDGYTLVSATAINTEMHCFLKKVK